MESRRVEVVTLAERVVELFNLAVSQQHDLKAEVEVHPFESVEDRFPSVGVQPDVLAVPTLLVRINLVDVLADQMVQAVDRVDHERVERERSLRCRDAADECHQARRLAFRDCLAAEHISEHGHDRPRRNALDISQPVLCRDERHAALPSRSKAALPDARLAIDHGPPCPFRRRIQ